MPRQCTLELLIFLNHSHSIVPGGFDVTSYTTRLTPLHSLMVRIALAPHCARGSDRLGFRCQTARGPCGRVLAARCARALRHLGPSRSQEGAGKTGCTPHPWSACNKKH